MIIKFDLITPFFQEQNLDYVKTSSFKYIAFKQLYLLLR